MIYLIGIFSLFSLILLFDLFGLKRSINAGKNIFLFTPLAQSIAAQFLLFQRLTLKEPQRVKFGSNESFHKDALEYYTQHIKNITNAQFVSIRYHDAFFTYPLSYESLLQKSLSAFIPWFESGATALKKKEITKNSVSFGMFDRNSVEVLLIEHIVFPSGIRAVCICGFEKVSLLSYEKENEIAHLAQSMPEDLSILSSVYSLLERLHEAKDSAQSKDTNLKFITHDIRSPLHNLSLILSSLKEESSDKEIIEAGMRSISSAQRVVDGILKSESSESLPTCDVAGILNDLALEFKVKAERKGLSFEVSHVPTKYLVSCNPDDLRRILQNFISNAIKYTQKGKISVGFKEESSGATIEIHDTGVGMNSAELSLFGKTEGRFKKDLDEGIGIGAVGAFKLVYKNQGKINLISEEKIGTKIYIYLKSA